MNYKDSSFSKLSVNIWNFQADETELSFSALHITLLKPLFTLNTQHNASKTIIKEDEED